MRSTIDHNLFTLEHMGTAFVKLRMEATTCSIAITWLTMIQLPHRLIWYKNVSTETRKIIQQCCQVVCSAFSLHSMVEKLSLTSFQSQFQIWNNRKLLHGKSKNILSKAFFVDFEANKKISTITKIMSSMYGY